MSLPSKDQLLKASKEELVELLLLSLQAQKTTTENMVTLTTAMEAGAARIKELESQNASLEAELLVLRNRP